MRADWEDAPLRVRERPSHTNLGFSIVLVCAIAVGVAYWAKPDQTLEAFGKARQAAVALFNNARAKTESGYSSTGAEAIGQAEEASERSQAEMLEGMEDIIVYKNTPPANPPGTRQTVFNDSNYTPVTSVNIMESRPVVQAMNERQSRQARQERILASAGLNGTSRVQLQWEDARGRPTYWNTTYSYQNSRIDNNSFCRNHGSGSIEYRTCRKAAKRWLNTKCGNANRVQGEWQKMYCLAYNGFRA